MCMRVCVYVKVPGAYGHFIRVVDVGAGCTTVTLAKAVVVHAVVFGLLFLLPSLTYNGQTLLHRPAERTHTNRLNAGAQLLLRFSHLNMGPRNEEISNITHCS